MMRVRKQIESAKSAEAVAAASYRRQIASKRRDVAGYVNDTRWPQPVKRRDQLTGAGPRRIENDSIGVIIRAAEKARRVGRLHCDELRTIAEPERSGTASGGLDRLVNRIDASDPRAAARRWNAEVARPAEQIENRRRGPWFCKRHHIPDHAPVELPVDL